MKIPTAFAGVWLRWYYKQPNHMDIQYASTDGDVFVTRRERFTTNGNLRSN